MSFILEDKIIEEIGRKLPDLTKIRPIYPALSPDFISIKFPQTKCPGESYVDSIWMILH